MSGENAGGGISISAANGRKNVKPVEAGSSDDEAGVDIVFPPDYLHAASGPVVAKAGRHAPAAMPLMPAPACSSQANTQAALRNHGIEAKGSFHLNRVPEGRYLPGLTSAGDTEGPAAPTPAAIRSTRGTPQEVHHKRYITRGTPQEVYQEREILWGSRAARHRQERCPRAGTRGSRSGATTSAASRSPGTPGAAQPTVGHSEGTIRRRNDTAPVHRIP
jgi:hypothetical protein